jgi:hypothetical protein
MKRANFNITHKDGDISKRVRESMGERKKEQSSSQSGGAN